MEKVYFKGLEELAQNETFNANAEKEFASELPILSGITESISTTAKTSRRDFLKMLGFSVTAAAVAASCEMPVRKSIPYAFKPEELVPGIANYYASTLFQGGDLLPVLVKTREGRPIKIEGNKLSSLSQGGTSARTQAAVISLYDGGARYTGPKSGKSALTWEKVDAEIAAKLTSIKSSGGKIALFTSTIPSPGTQAAIAAFATATGAEVLVNDAVSYSGALDANAKSFGTRLMPAYKFDKAKVVVGIGCDFLGTWLSPVEFAADYSKNRKISKGNANMSRHIQIESSLTITGASSDTRIVVKPNEEATSVVELYKAVSGGTSANAKINKVAQDLLANKGASIVVSGSNDARVQLVVNAINQALGNYGSTISFTNAFNTKQGSDKAALTLLEGLNNGTYKGVIFYHANPVLTHPMADKLKDAIKKAELSISLSERAEETAEACQFVCPDNHWLESWNDFTPKKGTYTTSQPTISKLFDTRQGQESLLKWAGNATPYETFLKENAQKSIFGLQSKYSGFGSFWDVTLHDGETQITAGSEASHAGGETAAAVSEVEAAYSKGAENQIKLYESIAVGNGAYADNPFLQELPDPITKVCWDNYVMVPVSWAKKNDIKNDLEMKEYQVVKITANGHSIELPAVAVPGMANGTFAIALGYGKTTAAHSELLIGKNAYPLMGLKGENFSFTSDATIEKTANTFKLAITQTHHNITLNGLGGIKKRKVVKETTLGEYAKNPHAGNEDREKILEEMVTLYYEHEKVGHHWTMSIDLNSCNGCGACVTACNIENNVPVVGKDQVVRSREMHWMRIDRYFTYSEMIEGGANTLDSEKLDIVFQPMLCQHCDNAPCENVCPVAATNHSSEGLNQMAYNRCIGTRYCANNCPYKVRRFNWYDYQGADAFDKKVGSMWANEDILSGTTRALQEPLTRLVLNPDVTVRSRGVIEKCSFCVQRLQEGKLNAKKENRPLQETDITSACSTACPTNAIVFGDRNNKESLIAKEVADERSYGVIEEIHTMPNVLYKTKVRNRS